MLKKSDCTRVCFVLLVALAGCSVVPGYASSDRHLNRGRTLVAEGDHATAVKEFTLALERNPHNEQAYYERADARVQMGDTRGAIADCDKAIARDPRSGRAYYARGMAKAPNVPVGGTPADLRGKDVSGAMADFAKSIELSPAQFESRIARMRVFVAQGDFPRAAGELDGLVRAQPKEPLWRGLLLVLQNQDAAAQPYFDRAFTAKPDIRADTQADIDRIKRRRATAT